MGWVNWIYDTFVYLTTENIIQLRLTYDLSGCMNILSFDIDMYEQQLYVSTSVNHYTNEYVFLIQLTEVSMTLRIYTFASMINMSTTCIHNMLKPVQRQKSGVSSTKLLSLADST
jgi:hypothetical protein